jgi:hypothetical protein
MFMTVDNTTISIHDYKRNTLRCPILSMKNKPPSDTEPATAWILDSPASRTVRNKLLLLINYSA